MAELILHLPHLESSAPERLPEPLASALRTARYAPAGSADALAAALGRGPLPPAAARSALGAGIDPGDAFWIRFDAVHMRPDLTAVWIDRPVELDFDAPALSDLRRELTELFESESLAGGLRFAGRFGLLALDVAPDCRFAELAAVQGGRLDECLPTGPDASRWRRLITAAQMLFHRFRALDRADPSGVGLWFWGGGRLAAPTQPAGDLRVVDAFDAALARGLGRWLGAPVADPDACWPPAADDDGRFIVELPDDAADPARALQTLVADWLVPALAALRRGRLKRIRIVGSHGGWRLGRFHRLALWRRRIRGLAGEAAP
jgi:hypothetical protein